MSPAASLKELAVYRGHRRLHGPISFDLYPGQVLRIRGGNGSGKTTLLRTILGLHKSYTGNLACGDSRLSYKPQVASMFESLRLSELWKMVIGVEPELFHSLVGKLRLSDHLEKPLGIMSGGENQRAMMLLAALRPHDLLLLDEPLAGVDDSSAEAIVKFVNSVRSGATIVVEHRDNGIFEVDLEVVLDDPDDNSY